MPVTSSVFNTWVASKKETGEAVSRLAALVRASAKPNSGVTPEAMTDAEAALESAESAQALLEAFAGKLGLV